MITFSKLGQYGRFGNQLFQIAGTIGFALKHGYNYGFYEWKDGDIPLYDLFKKQLPRVSVLPQKSFSVPWNQYPYIIPDNVSLEGYMQSEKYFAHCKDLVREYFTFKDDIFNVPIIPINSIAIHIRLGDYVGSTHYAQLRFEYYYKAIKYLHEHCKISNIYVFSDDIEKAKVILTDQCILDNSTTHQPSLLMLNLGIDPRVFGDLTYENAFGHKISYVCGNHYLADFYMAMQCTHHIIANSSFSWWWAWLSNNPGKTVIAPAQWFGPKNAHLSADDIYCEGWVRA